MDVQAYIERVRNEVQQQTTKRPVFLNLGYTQDDYYRFKGLMSQWLSCPNTSMHRAAQSLVKGKFSSKFAKMLAVEQQIMKKVVKKKTITLYRGINGAYCKRVKKMLDMNRKSVVIPLRGASSWTTNKKTAKDFGPIVLRHVFPIDHIISCHKSNHHIHSYNEDEYIVAVPSKKIRVNRNNIMVDKTEYEVRSIWW